jgi:hypothetical protein
LVKKREKFWARIVKIGKERGFAAEIVEGTS